METKKRVTAQESLVKTEKQRNSLIVYSITQLATLTGQAIAPERLALYCRALNNIGLPQLQFAFEKALQNAGDFLPSVEKIRQYSTEWKPSVIDDASRILERGDKPPDWEPMTKELQDELRALLEQAKRKFPATTRTEK